MTSLSHLIYLFTLVSILSYARPSSAQLTGLANEIYGPNSIIYGVKNVMGGVLAADKVHNNCLQKTLCDEFSG